MICRTCRSAIAKRWVVRVDGQPYIVIECDACHNPQPTKPRWFARLTAKDMTAA